MSTLRREWTAFFRSIAETGRALWLPPATTDELQAAVTSAIRACKDSPSGAARLIFAETSIDPQIIRTGVVAWLEARIARERAPVEDRAPPVDIDDFLLWTDGYSRAELLASFDGHLPRATEVLADRHRGLHLLALAAERALSDHIAGSRRSAELDFWDREHAHRCDACRRRLAGGAVERAKPLLWPRTQGFAVAAHDAPYDKDEQLIFDGIGPIVDEIDAAIVGRIQLVAIVSVHEAVAHSVPPDPRLEPGALAAVLSVQRLAPSAARKRVELAPVGEAGVVRVYALLVFDTIDSGTEAAVRAAGAVACTADALGSEERIFERVYATMPCSFFVVG